MQFKSILKFRYQDLPQEFICLGCSSVCQNPCLQHVYLFDQEDCDTTSGPYEMSLLNQIQQFVQIYCEFCGEYQKYFHYKIHSNMCKLLFEKSEFLLEFQQISLENQDLRCQICNQIPYRPQTNNDRKFICLFCIQQQNLKNINELSSDKQKKFEQIIFQCKKLNCQKYVKLNNTLKHYKKCQLKESEIIKSDEYQKLVTSQNEYYQFKQQYKKQNIGLKQQKQQIFNFMKQGYDLAKTKLVKDQLIQKIKTVENQISTLYNQQI